MSASDTLVAPGYGKQACTVYRIDTKDFEAGGGIAFAVKVGTQGFYASFELLLEGESLPTEGRATNSIAHAYDVGPGSPASVDYTFTRGEGFQFGATGNWFSAAGESNTYSSTVAVLESK